MTTLRLSPTERRLLERTIAKREAMRHELNLLTEANLATLIVRSRYPATDGVMGGQGPGGNDVARPTEGAVMRDAGPSDGKGHDTWPPISDDVRHTIWAMFGLISEADGVLAAVGKNRGYLLGIRDSLGVRNEIGGTCQACDRVVTGMPNDRLKSAYCPACHQAWMRAGYPDRHQFKTQRKERAS